jgi:hypothetical protein
MDWLGAAKPLMRDLRAKNPDLTKEELGRAFEQELVRDGVHKLNGYLDIMEKLGNLAADKRPVVVGLLFEMHTAKLYQLLPSGDFKLLSETQAVMKHHHH